MKSRSHVIQKVDVLLSPAGFVRTRTSWTRPAHRFTDVIDVQYATHASQFTINIGVLDPQLRRHFWTNESKILIAAEGVINCRIGHFWDEKCDRWFATQETSASEWSMIESVLNERVLPFLDKHHSPKELIQTLEDQRVIRNMAFPGLIYWSLLMKEVGESAKSLLILNELRGKYGRDPWIRTIDAAIAAQTSLHSHPTR